MLRFLANKGLQSRIAWDTWERNYADRVVRCNCWQVNYDIVLILIRGLVSIRIGARGQSDEKTISWTWCWMQRDRSFELLRIISDHSQGWGIFYAYVHNRDCTQDSFVKYVKSVFIQISISINMMNLFLGSKRFGMFSVNFSVLLNVSITYLSLIVR